MLDPVPRPAPTQFLTAREMLADPERYRHGCELWDGALLVREPSGGESEFVLGCIAEPLLRYVRMRRLGWVTLSNHGYLLARNPDRVLAPDAAYVSRERLPVPPTRGFTPLAPDFVVEVRSPSDRLHALVAKAGTWIAHGTRVVWVVDPQRREVVVVRPCVAPEVVGRAGSVSAAPALPRFRLKVAALFPTR
jgi:Uma2 family endonuclease